MELNNARTVYVVQNDARKDYSAAEQYGGLKDIFGNVGRVYNTERMIAHARMVLSNWRPGDSLLMAGDPALCSVAFTLVLEQDDVVNTLSWDRNEFKYNRRRWDFGPASFKANMIPGSDVPV